tara:strand:+ start:31107 stop:32246 length:1140 start_codon:yes stop_codon:yes gene_type:complete
MEQQDKRKIYERLSTSQIDVLHQKFMDGIAARTEKVLPECSDNFSAQARAALGEKVNEMLLLAKRCREDIAPKKLEEFVETGIKGIEKQNRSYKKQIKKDPWRWDVRRALNKKFNKRAEAPLAAATFGDDERIYLKLATVSVEESATYCRVADYIECRGYKICDYIKGYATDTSGKQNFKIGKLIKDNPILLRLFNVDETRASVGKYVVISRNKQDLERMSTGRGWSSCMAADGMFKARVPNIVGSMTLVAYLINANDPEVNDPLARLLLKPCDNREVRNKKSAYRSAFFHSMRQHFNHFALCLTAKEEPLHSSSIAFAAGATYGLGSQNFRLAVNQFCDDHLHELEEGHYMLHGEIYADGLPSRYDVGEDKMFPQRGF